LENRESRFEIVTIVHKEVVFWEFIYFIKLPWKSPWYHPNVIFYFKSLIKIKIPKEKTAKYSSIFIKIVEEKGQYNAIFKITYNLINKEYMK